MNVGQLREFIKSLPDDMPVATMNSEYGTSYLVQMYIAASSNHSHMHSLSENEAGAETVLIIYDQLV